VFWDRGQLSVDHIHGHGGATEIIWDDPRAEAPAPVPAPRNNAGWDQATYRCGRCGATCTGTTETEYLKAITAHRDAHALWEQIAPHARAAYASFLRRILAAPDLAHQLVAIADAEARS
jgi:hypothetical protein